MKTIFFFLLLIISLSTPAQITTDGSLGPQLNLLGPDYQIGPDLGQQRGGNLFHSFQSFNLKSSESATFSGPNHIQNVISRVTGGSPSNIDGLLRSTIPNADFYFLNPYGIMFGPNARLDVQGSFHASTADYLRLGENGRFDARNPNDSILTIAPIESFGFIDTSIASISIEGQGKIAEVDWDNQSTGLSVPKGKMLSLIGGDIEIKNGTFITTVTDTEFDESVAITRLESLNAPDGQINLAAVASSGEVNLGKAFLDVSSFVKLADISITNQSLLQVSGEGGGNVFIRGKHVFVKNSAIEAKTLSNQNGTLVDIQVEKLSVSHNSQIDARTEGKGTNIFVKIQANDSVNFYDGSNINLNTYDKVEGAGDAGIVLIEAPNISFIEDSGISNSTVGNGNAGNVIIRAGNLFRIKKSSIYISPFSASTGGNGGTLLIEAKDVLVTEGSYLSGTTFGPGQGGHITILANGKVTLSEANTDGLVSGIFSNSNPSKAIAKDAGNIILEAKELVIEKGAMISSSTISKPGRISGQGGNITLRVHGIIKINGVNLYGENAEGFGSGIYVRAKGNNTGLAGNINIEAQTLSITDGAVIASTTDSYAPGGQINIQVKDTISISGDSVNFVLRELAKSQRDFKTNFPESQDGLSISGIYGSSESAIDKAGMAGNIILNANAIFIKNGFINTSTQNAGGGNITINTPNLLYLQKGEITTSVNGGGGDSGNINISHPTVTVLNQAQIKAQADAGHGGNIRIVAEHFIASPDSLISASSRLGLDGNVQVDSPAVDLDAMLVVLPGGHVEARLKKCNIEAELENPNTFTVKKRYLPPPLIK